MVIYAPLSLVLSTLHKRSQERKQSQGSQLGVWVRGYGGFKFAGFCCRRLPRWRIDPLPIVMCCLPLLRFIDIVKKNQQYVGPLNWESGAKVTRCLFLFFEVERDLESPIGVAS